MTYNLQLMNGMWFYIEILEEGRQITAWQITGTGILLLKNVNFHNLPETHEKARRCPR